MGPDIEAALAVLVVAAITGGAIWYRTRRMPADLEDKQRVFNAEVGRFRRIIVDPARFATAYLGTIVEVVDDGVLIQLQSKQVSIPFTDIVAVTTPDRTEIGVWGANRSIVDAAMGEVR